MNYVVKPAELFGINYSQTDCEFSYNGGPGTSDPDCAGLCFAADD